MKHRLKHWVLTLLACLGILVITAVSVFALKLAKPAPAQEQKAKELPAVEVVVAQPESIDLQLPTQGMIQASRTTQLAAEVAGRVSWVSPRFKSGGRFKGGEELLRIEKADYEAALAEAKASLADAEVNLTNEEARAEQALRDWRRLGTPGNPSDLTLRKPQLKSARSRIEATQATLQRAQRNLERTSVKAPFGSTIDSIHTELGSYLSPGAPIARLLAEPPYEVRLPLSLDDYTLVSPTGSSSGPAVRFETEAGGRSYAWEGKIVREEGQIERDSRSIYLVAEVSPRNAKDQLLQPGLFVQAEIAGRRLDQVYRIPLKAIQGDDQLIVIGPEQRVEFRNVAILRKEGEFAFIDQGLNPGDRVCLTTLDVFIDGMQVDPRESAADAGPVPLP